MAFNEPEKWALSPKCHAVGIGIPAMYEECARNELIGRLYNSGRASVIPTMNRFKKIFGKFTNVRV